MNKLTIIGNLTRDPDLRTTANGISVCDMTVAVNRRKHVGQDDPGADYFRVITWRQIAESCAQYLAKGRKVAVTGSVSVRTYDGRDGQVHASLEVQADEVEFLTPRNSGTVSSDGYTQIQPGQDGEPSLPF